MANMMKDLNQEAYTNTIGNSTPNSHPDIDARLIIDK
jgi:hypothetical protein